MPISIQWEALARLALGLALGQVLLSLLARGLGARIPWRIAAGSLALVLLTLSPWLITDRLLAPVDEPIANNVPDAPVVADPDRHGLYNDVALQLLPWEIEVRRALRSGRLPLWSDLLDGGSSPWVNPQAAVLSPVALLARLLPIEHFLLGALALKMLAASQGAWLLARRLGAGRAAAALAGAGFSLGGAVMAWALFPLSSVAAWTPWLAAGVVGVMRREGALGARASRPPSPSQRRALNAGPQALPAERAGGTPALPGPYRPVGSTIATTAVLFAFVLLSGHPEAALAGTAFALFAGLAFRRRRTPLLRGIGGTALALALGIGLAAPHLVPFLRILPETQRAVRTLEEGPPPAAGAGEWFPGSREALLLAPANPRVYGRPFREPYRGPLTWSASGAGYAGLIAFSGLLAGLLAARRWRTVLPLAAFAAACFLLAAGFVPLERLLDRLPFLGAVAFTRFLPAAVLALVLSGALGIDGFLRRRPRALAWAGLALAAAASLALERSPLVILAWGLFLAGVLAARQSRRLAAALLAAALFADLLPWAWDLLPRGHRELFYPRTPLVEAATAVASEGEGGPWRGAAQGFLFYPSLLPVYGVAELRAHNPVALRQQLLPLQAVFRFRPEGRRYKSGFRNLDHPLLDFLNVRVVIAKDGQPEPRTLQRADDGRLAPMRLYVNPEVLPRLFLPVAVRTVDRDAALAEVAALKNPRRVVLTAEESGGWRPPRRKWDPGAVRISRWEPGEISIELPSEGEKLLATSLAFPAGWTARARGERLRTLTVNTAWLGVAVPDGTGRVELSFRPPGLTLGMVLFLLSSLAIIVLGWKPRRKPGDRRASRAGEIPISSRRMP